ncbi:hypothetical protein [Halomonas sp. JS92-SW72]|uniref:hypothetical protein n=1 Tax=Halomonas sp. JS92-SW72 TaxID=2306583 RepID=UPI000E5AC1CD|nr:hypothetical protein [Halomonas sp. JS92-SW72]AXY41594.1 hypothetical protein D1793_04940 [Halomonas sp. JS92-SW72]
MPFRFLNNYATQLAEPLTIGQTKLTIIGSGDEFADASPSTPYALTLVERNIRGVDLRREIVHVTGRAGSELTVLRAREGTGEDDWPQATPAEARQTAEGLNEAAQAVAEHEAEADPHPQYEQAIEGASYARQVALYAGPLDLTDNTAFVEIAVPAGHQLFLDALDLIVEAADSVSGIPELQAGPDDQAPSDYLAATAVSVDATGERQVESPGMAAAVTAVRVSVATAGSGTAWSVRPVLRGYLMEV